MYSKILRNGILFTVYGGVYFVIECIYKHSITDYRMFILGGLLGLWIGLINNIFSFETNFILQCIIGSISVTLVEAICGYQWNIIEGLSIWNYSNLPLSGCGGQINFFFSIIWMFLSGICIILDDFLRYKFFNEDKPYYKWLSFIIDKFNKIVVKILKKL